MRSTDERLALVKKRAAAQRRQRQQKQRILLALLSTAGCMVLILATAWFTSQHIQPDGAMVIPVAGTASLFTNGYFLGYAVVGVLAFLLGVSVTLLCRHLYHKNREEEHDDGADC